MSKFNLFHSNGRVKFWRQSHERYLPECTQKTIQGCGGSIMFVVYYLLQNGLINWDKRQFKFSRLYFPIFRTIATVLENVSAKEQTRSVHVGQFSSPFFKNYRKVVWVEQDQEIMVASTVTRPNLIENVWEIMFRYIRSQKKQPSSFAELREALKEVWESFPQKQIRKLYKGLPNRVVKMKKMKGRATKYWVSLNGIDC